MSQISSEELIAQFHSHSRGNREEIEASTGAQCYSCSDVYGAETISEWRDEWVSPETQNRVPRWSAICPTCGQVTVVGDASGLLKDQAAVAVLRSYLDLPIEVAR